MQLNWQLWLASTTKRSCECGRTMSWRWWSRKSTRKKLASRRRRRRRKRAFKLASHWSNKKSFLFRAGSLFAIHGSSYCPGRLATSCSHQKIFHFATSVRNEVMRVFYPRRKSWMRKNWTGILLHVDKRNFYERISTSVGVTFWEGPAGTGRVSIWLAAFSARKWPSSKFCAPSSSRSARRGFYSCPVDPWWSPGWRCRWAGLPSLWRILVATFFRADSFFNRRTCDGVF